MVRGVVPSMNISLVPSAIVRPCLRLYFHISFFQISKIFFAIILMSASCFALTARGILCGIHTSCIGSPFPTVLTKWSLVFRSFATFSLRLKTALILVYDTNNKNMKHILCHVHHIDSVTYLLLSTLMP